MEQASAFFYIEFTLNNGAAAYSQTPKELGSLSQSPIEK
ncbi:hypothetical protein LEP1GSC120_3353 [Leptospira santarosai str. 200702252]|nr:hypothetical protein LEP1GSC130_2575 [Leptospira santarosai str. 200403458]EMP00405.1 hypothetical protein LEP1GSC120_3353 [Leptospira santarosai str. 200702252]